MAEEPKSNNKCDNKDCVYYKERNLFHRHHFLWAITISSIIVIGVFILLIYSYHANQEKIVNLHAQYCVDFQNALQKGVVVKDSCYYINEVVLQKVEESQENIAQLLELQYNKLQNDFTLLSLWSSVLMIVFLVFSIYSVFKTDELMKQSRDVLQHADEAAGKVDEKMKELNDRMEQESQKATTALQRKTEAELERIKKEIDETILNFKELTERKAGEYEDKYQNYLRELEKANKKNQEFINLLIQAVRSSDSEAKANKEE